MAGMGETRRPRLGLADAAPQSANLGAVEARPALLADARRGSRRAAGGGLAALLAAFGLGVEEAEAASCRRRCRRKSGSARRRCLRRCNNKRNGVAITPGTVVQTCSIGGTCATGTCVGTVCEVSCQVHTDCPTGNCVSGICQNCPQDRLCGDGGVCCVDGTLCLNLGCVAPQV